MRLRIESLKTFMLEQGHVLPLFRLIFLSLVERFNSFLFVLYRDQRIGLISTSSDQGREAYRKGLPRKRLLSPL